jgi:hypothetical protein
MAHLVSGSSGVFRGRDYWSGYDTAQICLNGHVTSDVVQANPLHSQDFCSSCGARTTTQCPSCKEPIRGRYHHPKVYAPYGAPAYCHKCGTSYPWTAARIEAAKSLADEIAGLDESEKLLLKTSIDDIVRDTPSTQAASLRFKKFAAKGGKEVVSAMRDILVDVVSETVKKAIWGT